MDKKFKYTEDEIINKIKSFPQVEDVEFTGEKVENGRLKRNFNIVAPKGESYRCRSVIFEFTMEHSNESPDSNVICMAFSTDFQEEDLFYNSEDELIHVHESFYSDGRPAGVLSMIEGKLERYYPVSKKEDAGWCLIIS